MLPQASGIHLQKVVLVICYINQNNRGVKMYKANQKQHCKQAGATKSFDIRKLATLPKNFYSLNDIQQFIAYFHKYDWLCHLTIFVPKLL